MSICPTCGLPIKFHMYAGEVRPVNEDGSDHWELCGRVMAARNKTGRIDKISSGVSHGKIKSTYRGDIPPWEFSGDFIECYE